MKFVNFHAHTVFSIGDAIGYPKEHFKFVLDNAESDSMGMAITDHGNASSFGYAFEAAKKLQKKGVDFKFHPGVEFYYHPNLDNWKKIYDAKNQGSEQELNDELIIEIENESKGKYYDPIKRRHHLVVVAYNDIGLKNLYKLVSRSFRDGFYRYPRVDNRMLEECKEGLIISTACLAGLPSWLTLRDEDASKDQLNKAFDKELLPLLEIFGKDHAHLEIQFNKLPEQKIVNNAVIEYAKHSGYPILATADSHYCHPDYWKQRDLYRFLAWQSKGMQMTPEDLPASVEDIKCNLYPKNGEEMYSEYLRMYDGERDDELDKIVKNSIQRGWDLSKDLCEYVNQNQELKLPKNRSEKTTDEILEDLCLNGLVSKGLHTKDEYVQRLETELSVIKKKNFSNYFVVLHKAMNEVQKYQLSSPGRGCLDGSCLVLTDRGYIPLEDVSLDDSVFDLNGQKSKILKKFQYEISEPLLKLKTDYSFQDLILTDDHKLLDRDKRWKCAKLFSEGDLLYVPFPKIKTFDFDKFDLSWFCFGKKYKTTDNFIEWENSNRIRSKFSIRKISKIIGVSRNSLRFIKKNGALNKNHKPYPKRHFDAVEKLESFLMENNMNLQDWRRLDLSSQVKIPRNIEFDESFCYFLGRWIGDGWVSVERNFVAIAFNSSDKKGMSWFDGFAERFNLNVCWNHSNKKLVSQGYIYCQPLARFMKFFFKDYQSKSDTKYMGTLKRLPDNKLKSLIDGIVDSDGYIENSAKTINRYNIDTTSLRLALELKEALLKLKIPCSINKREKYVSGGYVCNESYKVRFKLKNDRLKKDDFGYFTKIRRIEKNHNTKCVFDISVEGDPSYLVDNCVVHNSGCGSLVLYVLNITQLDPIKHGLLFERFLSEHRSDPPDVDLDSDDKPRSLEILKNLFGDTEVIPISNYNTYQLKSLVKSISKFYSIDFADVNQVTTAIDDEAKNLIIEDADGDQKLAKMTHENVLKHSESYRRFIDKYPHVGDHIEVLFNQIKSVGRHAGGIVITECSEEAMPIIQHKGDDQTPWTEGLTAKHLEPAGIIKYDFLAIQTLGYIRRCIELILENKLGRKASFEEIDEFYKSNLHPDVVDDGDISIFENVYHQGKFAGIFQFTNDGAQKLCVAAKPKRVMDLAILTSIFRPGPLKGKVDKKYVNTVENPEDIRFDHPIIEKILGPTNGFIVFQEQFMYLANELAGFSLEESNTLRKLLTKPLTSLGEEMIKKREETGEQFVQGCIEHGISEARARSIWDDEIMGFVSYGFNKSHALAYSYVSYQCAWLYHNHPDEWVCAYLEKSPDKDRDKAISDVESVGYQIGNVDIMKSTDAWTVEGNTLIPSLQTIKNLGEAAVLELVEERRAWSPPEDESFGIDHFVKIFESFFYNFVEVEMKRGTKTKKKWKFSKFNKRSLEALIKLEAVGSLGIVGPGRLFENHAHMHRCLIDKWSKKEQVKFDIASIAEETNKEDWEDHEKVVFQAELLGTYDKSLMFTNDELAELESNDIWPLSFVDGSYQDIWFILEDWKTAKSKNGNKYYKLFISDIEGTKKIMNYWFEPRDGFHKFGTYACTMHINRNGFLNLKKGCYLERIR